MIDRTPPSLDNFPVPVTGQEIPRGWFARLVSFINSLVLHGDRQYFCVTRSNAGTTIEPTKKLIDLLSDRGGSAAASGATGIEASVSGGTASITLTGGTGSVNLVGTGAVTISGNTTTGDIEINATGGTSGATGLPYYETGLPPAEVSTVYGPYAYDVWLIGHAGQNGVDGATLTLAINTNLTLILYDANFGSGSQQSLYVPVFVPIPAGNSFELYGSADFDLRIYQCV